MDRLKRLEKEIEALRSDLVRLQGELTLVREEVGAHRHPLQELLRQRGLQVLSHGERSRVLVPPDATQAERETFYAFMRRYSFRLFLRDLIQFPSGEDLKVLTRYCSMETVKNYLRYLSDVRIVEFGPHRRYRLLVPEIHSFGPTLEWYVREVFHREFLAPALFNVRIRHTLHGGDYDVVALLSGHLVYVEVKSSPPRGVEAPAVAAFLKRLGDLRPRMAVFLVDTELRMYDKIVPLFSDALREAGRGPNEWAVVRLVDEIFHVRHALYLLNSRKGIYSNLRLCFRDFLHWEGEARLPV
jgi:hypothetical protein